MCRVLPPDDLPKPGYAQKVSPLKGIAVIPERVVVSPYPNNCVQGIESYKAIRDPDLVRKYSGNLSPISEEKTEGFDESNQCTYFFRKNIFLGYLVISVLVSLTTVCCSVFLDLSILQYLGLIHGQLHTVFIVVFAHCVFLLILSGLGMFSVCRRGYKTLITYLILSATLLMLVIMCIFYGVAMRHEVQLHLYKTMIHGVHTYAAAPGQDINRYWDNVQQQFSCCGLYGPIDWKLDVYLNSSVPDSCCKHVREGCGKGQLYHPDPKLFYVDGCYQPFFDWLNVFTYEMIGIACLLVVWQIIGLGISWNLARITKHISRNQRKEMKRGCC